MNGLRDDLARYRDSFLSSDHSHLSVNGTWVSFKSEVIAAIERFDISIKRLIKRGDRLYFRACKSNSPHQEPLQTVQSTCSKGHQRCIYLLF